MSQDIQIERVTMRFGGVAAVKDVDLTIRAGEFFSFLGPSGCGKTTLLRLIAGFIEPTEGAIRIGGRDMRGLGPNRRPTAMIFQSLALFPLMSVADNIAFGLEVRGIPTRARRARAEQLLDLVALPGTADKRVTDLSGGQRQRVAIARALAVEPEVLLLDEPLSALDLKLRQHMRAELRAIQRRTGVTFVYITHDQGEALAMSDRVGVMSQGTLQQVDAPEAIYAEPATAFVASFVGENNGFAGRVAADAGQAPGGRAQVETASGRLAGRNPLGLRPGDQAILFVRPERIGIGPDQEIGGDGADGSVTGGGGPDGAANRLTVTVTARSFEGPFVQVEARRADGGPVALQVPNAAGVPDLRPGAVLTLAFRPEDALILPAGG